MDKLIAFLRARLAERSSRVQLLMLVVLALVIAGVVSVEQITTLTEKIVAALAVLGPLVGIIIPDTNHDVNAAAVEDAAVEAAVKAATEAAERAAGPAATNAAKAVASVVDRLGL